MPATRAAPRLVEIVVADPPDAWEAAGFTVTGATCRIGEVAIRLVGREHGRRIVGWAFDGIEGDRTEIDGLPLVPPAAEPGPPHVHANGCVQIDHVVVLTPDLDRTLGAFAEIGLETRRIRDTDTYGLPMRQAFLRSGQVILEVVGSLEPSDGPTGFFGLAHTVDDLDATAAQLGSALGRIKDAVQPGRRIATLRHKEVGMSVATAFMSRDPDPARAPDDDIDPGSTSQRVR